jgi:hypothetical protein
MRKKVRKAVFWAATALCLTAPAGSPARAEAVFDALTAEPTQSQIVVNGAAARFEAYSVNDNNYFKIRDVAYALKTKFDVGYDEGTESVIVYLNRPYTPVGGEMRTGETAAGQAEPSTDKIFFDGVSEIPLTAYKINDNNYVKLRDLAEAVGFGVDWRDDTVWIETDGAATDSLFGDTETIKEKIAGKWRGRTLEASDGMDLDFKTEFFSNGTFETEFLSFPILGTYKIDGATIALDSFDVVQRGVITFLSDDDFTVTWEDGSAEEYIRMP